MLLVRVAVLPDLLFAVLHFNTYLLYLVAPPALFGAVFKGALGRTFRHTSARLWLLFFCWALASVPFSSWVGGSVAVARDYTEFCFPLLFTVAGMTVDWKKVRATCYVMGAAGVINILAASVFVRNENGRLDMDASGTIGNSNDLAAHLILVLPFILYIATDRAKNRLLRLLLIAPMAYALWIIFGTASRGALIALLVMFLFVLLRASGKRRVAALVLAGTLAAAVPVVIQGSALTRLSSLFGKSHPEEAEESQESRLYVLQQSLRYTAAHPLFGIGMGQFPNYEGASSASAGKKGYWHQTHNAYTQVSSECGIPAMIFFISGLVVAIRSVSKVHREARKRGFTDIVNVSFCFLLSMLGYLVAIFFLSHAYWFDLPVLIGLAIAISSAATAEMAAGQSSQPMPAPGGPGVALRAGRV